MSRTGITESRPTEDTAFVAGTSTAIFAEELATLFGSGPQALRWAAITMAVLPRGTTWIVDQYRNYWPVFHRGPRPGSAPRRRIAPQDVVHE